jgi:hypothetical protein
VVFPTVLNVFEHSEETPMTKSRYGLLAGIAGAAVAAAYWWRGRTDWVARKMSRSSLPLEKSNGAEAPWFRITD